MEDTHITQAPHSPPSVNDNATLVKYLPIITFIFSIVVSFVSAYGWVQVSVAKLEIELKTTQTELKELRNDQRAFEDRFVRKEDLDNRWLDLKADVKEIKADMKELRSERAVSQHKKEVYGND